MVSASGYEQAISCSQVVVTRLGVVIACGSACGSCGPTRRLLRRATLNGCTQAGCFLPLFIVAALLMKTDRWFQTIAYVSILMLALFTVMFVHWYWVG
jgi:hypothetical protein